MPIDGVSQITPRHARFLCVLLRDRSYHEAADELFLSYDTAKAYACEVVAITGCQDQWQLRRWWREHEACWAARMLADVGVPIARLHDGVCDTHADAT